jgi:hypothetical protein
MPADFLTKRVEEKVFERCREQSGILPLPAKVQAL